MSVTLSYNESETRYHLIEVGGCNIITNNTRTHAATAHTARHVLSDGLAFSREEK